MSDTAQQGYLTVASQTAQGTPATDLTTGMRTTKVAISGSSDSILANPEIGGGRDVDTAGVALGSVHAAGNIEGYIRSELFGFLLLGLGLEEVADPVQDGVTGAYTHTFTPADTPGWLTLESSWGLDRAIRRFSDCVVDSLELSVAGNDFATFVAAVLGLSEEWRAAASVPVYPALDPIATYLGSAIVLDGLGTYRLRDTKLKISNATATDEEIVGQRALADLTMKRREVMLSGTMRLDGSSPAALTDLYRAGLYGDKAATEPGDVEPYHTTASVTFGSPRKVGTSASVRYGLRATMTDIVVKAFPLESSGDDVLEVAIEAQAFDDGTNPIVSIDLYNTRSTKYAA